MPEPLRVPLSTYHTARLAQLGAEQAAAQAALDKANACLNEMVSAVVGAVHDVSKLTKEGWKVAREGDEIVCTPPVEQPPE